MAPLFDMIANAQNGKGMELLARQFNLNQQQAQLALDALLPAFSEGLKRNTADPMGLGGLMQAMMTGNHAKYFEDAANAFSPSAVQDGNAVLGQLFGSKDLSRAVAANAQAMTGIGESVLKQMLPVIASMVMGGLAKQTMGQMQAAAGMGAGNPFGELIEQMMRQGMGAGGATRAPQMPNPMDNPFGKMFEQMMGGGGRPQPGGASSQTGNPWLDMLGEMMKGAAPQPSQSEPDVDPQPRRHNEPRGERTPRNPVEDMLGQMFDTGREVQQDYQNNVKSIFDQYVRNMDRLR
ncbi:MAG: DUF937 domain-containing protein [Rhizobiaceae bacterium]|jgi:hypothetical protein|nr:DUF937 domain-containing protein [Rhizobiaceae bacterium]